MAKFQKLERVDGKSYIKTRRVIDKSGKTTYEPVYQSHNVLGEDGKPMRDDEGHLIKDFDLDADGNKIPVMTSEVAYYEAPHGDELRTTTAFAELFDERAQARKGVSDARKAVATSLDKPFSPEDFAKNPQAAGAIAGALSSWAKLSATYPSMAKVDVPLVRDGDKGGLRDLTSAVSKQLSSELGGTPGMKISDMREGSIQQTMAKHQRDVRAIKGSRNVRASVSNPTLQRQMMAKLNSGASIKLHGQSGKTFKSEPLPDGFKSWNDYFKTQIQQPRESVQVMENYASEAWAAVGADGGDKGVEMNELCSCVDLSGFKEAVSALNAAESRFAEIDAAIAEKAQEVTDDRLKGQTYAEIGSVRQAEAQPVSREVEAPEETAEATDDVEFE